MKQLILCHKKKDFKIKNFENADTLDIEDGATHKIDLTKRIKDPKLKNKYNEILPMNCNFNIYQKSIYFDKMKKWRKKLFKNYYNKRKNIICCCNTKIKYDDIETHCKTEKHRTFKKKNKEKLKNSKKYASYSGLLIEIKKNKKIFEKREKLMKEKEKIKEKFAKGLLPNNNDNIKINYWKNINYLLKKNGYLYYRTNFPIRQILLDLKKKNRKYHEFDPSNVHIFKDIYKGLNKYVSKVQKYMKVEPVSIEFIQKANNKYNDVYTYIKYQKI